MELENSALYDDVKLVINSGSKPVNFSWRGEVIADGVTHNLLQILSLDVIQDYELNYSDEIILTTIIPLGTFAKYIYPFRDNLEIIMYKVPLTEAADTKDITQPIQSERYTAVLLNGSNVVAEAAGVNSLSVESMNLTSIPTVTFQLIDKAVEQLRLVNVLADTYRNCIPGDVVKAILTKESKKLKLADELKTIGVTMVDPDNLVRRTHVQIPHGIPLVDLPMYVQHKCGGIYNAGLSYYYQNNHWHIYPCYNPNRYTGELRTITIINIPSNKYPGTERSYVKIGNNLTILSTGDSKLIDPSDKQQYNNGNGALYADGNQYMDGFVKVEGNKATSTRSENTSEYVSEAKKNKFNNVKLSDRQITSNTFVEHSKLARRQGSIFSFVWENSDQSLVVPGMMVKIMYLDQKYVKELYGTVLKMHHYTQLKGTGLTANRHNTSTVISVFVAALEGQYEKDW